MPSLRLLLAALLASAAVPGGTANASSTSIIYSFNGGVDGTYIDSDLAMDAAGNLYGTSVRGGDHASGTVWQLRPNGDGTWTHNVLYSFTGGADGAEPYKGVTLDAAGNLYGTAVTGGGGACEGGCGVAYKLTNKGGAWTQTVLHAFQGADDGQGPGARLTVDDDGTIYGMAPTGGAYGAGTIYAMTQGKGGIKFKVIHAFTGGNDGAGGYAGALILRNGDLYGAATSGGKFGEGTIYRLQRKTHGWKFRVLYAFRDQPDGGFPYGGLTFDAAGNIYGTTYYAGANDVGCVYELSPGHHGKWKERVLYSFKGGADGADSIANVNFDTAGNIYGTASEGGAANLGVIFRLAPKAHHTWSESVVHSFTGLPDGALPYNGMVDDGHGHFFGATTQGGAGDNGAIYQFTP
jgi:uncharacterized repeat protein (TIGR03803 family)